MTISTDLERLNYGSPAGCIATGLHREIISVTANTTLTKDQSGALVLLAVASGATVTLPAPVEGMQFDFGTTVTRTSNSYKIITDAATTFLVGAVMAGDATIATSGDVFEANGTTIVSVTMDGDTKGGFIGTTLRFRCISSTQWYVEGLVIGTGTMATPFATS
jgi:hypothetical protein